MDNKNNPLVEVLLLTYNGKDHLMRSLASLRKTNYKNMIITVIDNGSEKEYHDFIKNNYPQVKILRYDKNKSFSEANNIALKKSKAKYCILLNDDTEHDPNWIIELVKVAEKNPDIGALQPKILSMRNRKIFDYAGGSGGFIDLYGYPLCRGRVFNTLEKDKGQYNDEIEIFWACGCAIFLNRERCKEAGYLDETIGSYGEELDLCWRLNLLNYKIKIVPRSKVYHLGSVIWGKKIYKMKKEYLLHRNHLIILFKNYPIKRWIKIIPSKMFFEMIAFFVFFFLNPIKSAAVFKANAWILIHIPLLVRKNREISKLRKTSEADKKIVSTPIVLRYYLERKKYFTDYIKYIPSFNNN